jgi:uncharacterized protein
MMINKFIADGGISGTSPSSMRELHGHALGQFRSCGPALCGSGYNCRTMSLIDQIQKDLVAAMKAKNEARLSCLRMVKTALTLRQTEKMGPLDDKESQQVLATLIKQRKDSVEQFSKGGRQEMADKEAAEIKIIESYMPQAASAAEIAAGVKATIAEMDSPTMKDMGTVMKNAMARFAGAGMRVDGKVVSDAVKKELAGK